MAVSTPSWGSVSKDVCAHVLCEEANTQLAEARHNYMREPLSAAQFWKDRVLERTGFEDWVRAELVQHAVDVLLGPGQDLFMNTHPGWGKTVVLQMVLLGATGVCTACFPLASLTLQVHGRLHALAEAANARAKGVVVRVFHVTAELANAAAGTALRAVWDRMAQLVLAAKRNTLVPVIMVFGPEVLESPKFRQLLLAVNQHGALKVCVEDEVHMKRDFNYRGSVGLTAGRTCRAQQQQASTEANDPNGALAPSIVLASGSCTPDLRRFLMEDSGFREHNVRTVSGPVALGRTSIHVSPVSGESLKTVAETMAATSSVHRQQRLQAGTSRGEPYTCAAQLMFVPRTTDGYKLQHKVKEEFYRLKQEELHGWTRQGPSPTTTMIHGKQDSAVKEDLEDVITGGLLDIAFTTETLTAGVDFRNMELVVVYQLSSMCKWYQSSGRAGRGDGMFNPSSITLYNPTKFQALHYRAAWEVNVAEKRANTQQLDALGDHPPTSDGTTSDSRTSAAAFKVEQLLLAHARGRLDELKAYHAFLNDHVSCRWQLVHDYFLPPGVPRPARCQQSPWCDNCSPATPRFQVVPTTTGITAAIMIAHDMVAYDEATPRTFMAISRALKIALKEWDTSEITRMQRSGMSAASAKKQQGNVGYPAALAPWCVDCLISAGVLTPTLTAKWTEMSQSKSKSTKKRRLSSSQPGSNSSNSTGTDTRTRGELARVGPPGGTIHALMRADCHLEYSLALTRLVPDAKLAEAGNARPFTQHNTTRGFAIHTVEGLNLHRPIFPRQTRRASTTATTQTTHPATTATNPALSASTVVDSDGSGAGDTDEDMDGADEADGVGDGVGAADAYAAGFADAGL